MGPNNRFRKILAGLASLCLLGQPYVAAAQSYGYQVPLSGMDQTITQGQLNINPASFAFGTLVLGSTAATTASIKNTGQDSVAITGFNLPAPFTQSNSCPATLVGGASCNVTVTYTPTTAGSNTATLTVLTADPAAKGSFAVTGNAVVPTTNLGLSANTVDFGDADVGSPAAAKSLTITNNGNSPATVNGIGASGSEFNQSNNCASTLAPGASCSINLSFVPSAYGSRSGNLNVYEQASGTLYSVALVGSGNAAVMSVSPTSRDLGAAIVNYSSTTAQVAVSNVGNKDITGLSFSSSSLEYTVSAKTCAATLAPNASCTVTVRFAPSAAGARNGVLNTFTTNAGSAAVALTGLGTPQAPSAAASVPSLAFGNIPVDGSSVAQQVTFNNTGNVALSLGGVSVSAGNLHYTNSTTCGTTLAVGASCTASVTFTPRAAGSLPGTLRAAFSSGNVDVALSGAGTLGEATVSPSSVSFADQQVASTSAVRIVTVTNSGNRKLTFSGVSIVGGTSTFAQSNTCAEVLPNATCTVNVTFTPTASGPFSGNLAMVHDGVNGTTTVPLDGTGRAQSASISAPAFGSTAVGSSTVASATLSNTGIGILTVTPPTASSVSGTGYSFVSTTCNPTVAVGASCTVTVRFSPTSTAPASASLTVATGAGAQTANFGSTGIQGFASVSPSSLTFAAQQIASTSPTKTVTVTNTGTDVLTFTSVGISAGGSEFAQTNDCAAVAVGGTCTVNVAFTPTFNGTRYGTLSFVHNGGGIANVDLTGSGQAQSATLSDVSFGAVNVGANTTLTSTLTNTGIGALSVTPPANGSVSSAQYSFVSTTCGTSLAAGASCTTTVRFAPTSVGAKNGFLAITTGAGLLNSALSGTGNQAVLFFTAPTSVNFGSRQVGGAYASAPVTLNNNGNIAATGLTLTPTSVWSLSNNNCGTTLAAGSSCTFVMTFSPTAAQAYTGTVTATAATSLVSNQMTVSGTGQAQSATLSAPAFVATPVGSSSTATATLSNTGVGPLSVTVPTAAAVTGSGYSFVSTDCPASVAASSSCQVTVRFSPTNTTNSAGALSIATGAGTQSVNFGSTGIQGYASINPSSLAFAAQQVDSTSPTQTVTVTNTGTDVLAFSGVGISSGVADYGQSNNCASVPVNGTCTVTVSFKPSAAGARPGVLGFTHNGGGIATVALSGTGQGQSASLGAVDFGAVDAGTTPTMVSTLTNTGIGILSVTTPDASTVTGAGFSFVSTTCGTSLAAGGSCTTTVRFSPTNGGARSGNLAIATGAGTQNATLSGTGNQAVLTFSSPSTTTINWGNRQVGGSYASSLVTLTNSGNVAASSLVLTPTSAWTLASNTCGASLAASSSCTFVMMFNPVAVQAYSGSVTASAAVTSVANQMSMTGTGQAQSATLAAPTFAATAVGSSKTGTATLTNTGVGPLSVTVPAAASVTGTGYSFVSTDCTASVSAGGTCSVVVRFSPTSTAPSTGALAIATGAGTQTASFGSTGIQGFASISPSSLTFAATQVGATAATQVVTVTNTGTNTLTFSAVGISAGPSDYNQTNTCASVAVNGTCTVTVAFTPSTTGSRSGTLAFTHDGGGLATVSLTGTGQGQSASLTAVNFGGVDAGTTPTLTSTLSNTGIGALTVTPPTAASVTGTGFSFVSTTCGPTLAVSGSCTTTVRFSPTNGGAQSGNLAIATGAGTQNATLSGTGNQAVLAFDSWATSLGWGNQQVGSNVSSTSRITLTNSGNIAANNLALTPTSAWTLSGSTCGTSLAASASCSFYIVFSPTAVQSYSGTLSATASVSSVTNSVTMTGTGQAQSATLSTPSFPATPVGSSSTAVATLTNTGVGPLSITVPSAPTATSGAAYSLSSTDCTSSLAAGSACSVTVRFSPTSTTPSTGVLAVITGAGQQAVNLGSTGIQGYASVSPGSLTYGTYGMWTTSPAQTVTVTNVGTNTLTFTGVGISTGTSDFGQSNNCASVPVNGTCTINVSFSPSTGGTRTGTLSLTHNGGGIANVSLTGTGQGPSAVLSMGGFPATAVGSSSTAVATLTNTGIGPMPVGSPVVTGDAAYSVVSTTCSSSIPVNSNCTSTVRFAPTSAATATGNFAINDWNQWHNAALSNAGIAAPTVSASFSPASVTTGANTTFSWSTNSATSASVTCAAPAYGSGSGTSGSIVVGTSGTGTGSCTVTANNTVSGSATGSATVSVIAAPSVTAAYFTPGTVTAGYSSTFVWSTSGANAASVSCAGPTTGSGSGTSGSINVTTSGVGTGSCTVSATNAVGTAAAASSNLNIVAGPAITAASFSPSSVRVGDTTTFSWSTSNATSASVSCSAPASGSASGLSGSTTVSATATGTGSCTLTASNAAGTVTSYQANLSVAPAYTYAWQTGAYSTPSACGTTTATRSVWCQRSDGTTVADSYCGAGKPATTTSTTDYSACSYNFSYGGWNTPAGCGYVTQTRSSTCYRSDGTVAPASSCGSPTTTQGAYDYSACTYSYSYGAWSTPAGCGYVTQTRSATCYRSDGSVVDNSYCGAAATTQGANDYSACTYAANLGGWSACSNSCGSGSQSRSVSCSRSDGATVDNAYCGNPASSQSCSDTSGCPPPVGTFTNTTKSCPGSYTSGRTYNFSFQNTGSGTITGIAFTCPAGPFSPQNGSGPSTLGAGATGTYSCMYTSGGTASYACAINITGSNASNSGATFR